MQLRKTPKNHLQTSKTRDEDIGKPVVNERKTTSWKNIFATFSQFVAIGGDLV